MLFVVGVCGVVAIWSVGLLLMRVVVVCSLLFGVVCCLSLSVLPVVWCGCLVRVVGL